jgi:hypothetical protein
MKHIINYYFVLALDSSAFTCILSNFPEKTAGNPKFFQIFFIPAVLAQELIDTEGFPLHLYLIQERIKFKCKCTKILPISKLFREIFTLNSEIS